MLWTWYLERRGWIAITDRWREMVQVPFVDNGELDAELRDHQNLVEYLVMRWHKMKEAFAASGTLNVSARVPNLYGVRPP
jgi:hypothetical protein